MAQGGGDADAQRSRRKPGKDEVPAKKPFTFERKQVITAIVAVVVLALFLFVTQKDGGAPQSGGVFSEPRAAVASWSYVAETAAGGTETLCADDTDACDADRLWRLRTENATCTIRAELLLANTGMPVLLRDVRATLNATAWAGDYTISNNTTSPINLTTTWVDKDLGWDNGWWWRAEDETVAFRFEVPCDTHTASVNIRVQAKSIDGEAWDETQQARIAMHQEFLAKLAAAPGAGGASPFTG